MIGRRAAKRDANEAEIFDYFRQAGFSVLPISAAGAPDAVVAKHSRIYLVEIKRPKGRLTEAQRKFHDGWKGPRIHILRSVQDAEPLVNGWV